MNLINILKNIPAKPFAKYGSIISFGDIMETCKLYGQDNHRLIEAYLKNLENENYLKVIYSDDFGYEDLIVGVKITS
ncbi:hypothetical protein RKS58_06945 [Lysinibacillus capsici]|uniref:hypothetical protein n=1 Tax=Lysinibacillus capsici TaxID=2115968 RepID=UPI0028BE4984|nr:hypothetical protein [Lysinibacillus capsici]WNN77573.1 hypothetical protein RKS58_06945 [Lysinibacillus capsici]